MVTKEINGSSIELMKRHKLYYDDVYTFDDNNNKLYTHCQI